jgi:2-(1,2-epoxy-1,2-dihydrophenyl)acetyl-CoA isomerase
MPTYDTIDYAVENGIGEIYLNRPGVLNAFNNTLVEELFSAVQDAMERDSVYVIILSGRGRAFCSGVDTNQTLEQAAQRDRLYNELRLTRVHTVSRLLYRGPKPTIAAINGPAIGGGASFTLSCDLRVMAENAWMTFQYTNIGISAGASATWILPRLIGESKSKELVYTGRDISAVEAEELGLLVEVTEEGKSMEAARELALMLRDKPAKALRTTKELFTTPYTSIDEAYAAGNEAHWRCLRDPEHQEALDALGSDRVPDYDREY